MADKKYQVFVSSTFRDLADERQDAIRNILDLKHIPAGMELFPAADVQQLTYIKKVIDECDYYLLIVGGRYGSMDGDGVSFTEREYDYAVETGKVVLAFVHEDPAQIPLGKSEVKPKVAAALEAFRKKVMTGRLVQQWSTRQSLEPLVLKALIHAFNDMPQTGWIRGDAAANQEVLEQANKALQENATLRAELTMLKAVPSAKYENLADLDDQFVVRYKYRYQAPSGSTRYPEGSATFTWRQLFLLLAANLDIARTEAAIVAAVKQAADEADVSHKPFSVNEIDVTRIKVQFIALGLITARVTGTTQGGTAEFLTLTDKGRALFMEGMVVRRAIPE